MNKPQMTQMNAAPKTQRRGAKARSEDGSVLQIGMQYFWFDSHQNAAKAFELLSKAAHVQQEYRPRLKGPYHDYFPRELIGEISVKMVPCEAFKNRPSSVSSVAKERSEP